MPKNLFRTRIYPDQGASLRSLLTAHGYEVREVGHALWQAKKERSYVTLYRNGEIIVRGKNSDGLAAWFQLQMAAQPVEREYPADLPETWVATQIYGEQKYWGPLISAAILVDGRTEKKLSRIGLHRYGASSDLDLTELAKVIRKTCKHSSAAIRPNEYNELFIEYQDQAPIVSHANAQVIKNIYLKENCTTFIVPDAGDENLLRQLTADIPNAKLILRLPHEVRLAIDAAHILAKCKYYEFLAHLEEKYDTTFPENVSQGNESFVNHFVEVHGNSALKYAAKLYLGARKDHDVK
ncbi:MAG: hypothetical protein ACOY90_10755 [Candidatus Zhuqueibacterota bacterium]